MHFKVLRETIPASGSTPGPLVRSSAATFPWALSFHPPGADTRNPDQFGVRDGVAGGSAPERDEMVACETSIYVKRPNMTQIVDGRLVISFRLLWRSHRAL
jgi:hypothetical protein